MLLHGVSLARAAITKYHRLGCLSNKNLFSSRLEVQDQSVRGLLLFRAMREGYVPGLSPWLIHGSLLPVSSHSFFPVPVCVQISSSYKAPSHVGSGFTLTT